MSNVPYYSAKQIAENTWQIEYSFTNKEHVYGYLVEGRDYALVIDTMLGYGNFAAFCKTLTDKPVKLINTHFHLDHTGGNFGFDSCFLHPADMPYFYSEKPFTAKDLMERAAKLALPEYADKLEEADFVPERPMKILPVWDGDAFDLGDRQIEVVQVGGHTPGSVVLIDPKTRICFSGDACNSNTLMFFEMSLSVEEYLGELLRFKKHQNKFDMLWGGHEVLQPTVIDEAIELAARVIAGTDDKEQRIGMFGNTVTYAARHVEDGFGREDGKQFNMCYDPARILRPDAKGRTIGR